MAVTVWQLNRFTVIIIMARAKYVASYSSNLHDIKYYIYIGTDLEASSSDNEDEMKENMFITCSISTHTLADKNNTMRLCVPLHIQ